MVKYSSLSEGTPEGAGLYFQYYPVDKPLWVRKGPVENCAVVALGNTLSRVSNNRIGYFPLYDFP